MTQLIKKQDWKGFFDRISYDFLDWETSVRIISDGSSSQVLPDGLPFNSIKYEDQQGNDHMDVEVGARIAPHEFYSIYNPQLVSFEPAMRGTGGTLDIEDAEGRKTLIEFTRPRRMRIEYVRSEVLTVG